MSALSDSQLAQLLIAAGFPLNPRVIAEGIGIIHGESGGDPKSIAPGNPHIGLWALSPDFGSDAERLDAYKATVLARKQWEKDGSFWPAWGRWQAEQSGTNGATNWHKYINVARQAIRQKGGARGRAGKPAPTAAGDSSSGGPNPLIKFLVTACFVLGGASLVALGLSRAAGSSAIGAANESQGVVSE